MKVLVTILAQQWVHTTVAYGLIPIILDQRHEKQILFIDRRPVDFARNAIVKFFLQKDFDYLLMMDHDNPCIKNPLDLIDYRKDIIFCPTPTLVDKKLRVNTAPLQKPVGLYKVQKAGTGCVLISRKALETIPKPLFKFKLDKEGMLKIGEDIDFCNKAKKAGFELYAHADYQCRHFYEVDMWDIINDKWDMGDRLIKGDNHWELK